MGRRSTHSPEQLRELILQAATEIIEQDGLEGLSAREIASRINYSPGTLYNVFENLDDMLLTIEARLLDKLAEQLADTDTSGSPQEQVSRLAATYYAFSQGSPKLWSLLVEHGLPSGRTVPPWYQAKVECLLAPLRNAIAPLIKTTNSHSSKDAARTLWAGIHGVTALATMEKLPPVTGEAGAALVDDLVTTYLAGLSQRSSH
jgi:AcrR family transcriptional regulator